MAKKIIFTGGGTAGHVTLNLALIPIFLEKGWDVVYIGSYNGLEKELVSRFEKVKYIPILTGKMRRYFSWQNFIDMVKIPFGIMQATFVVFKQKPDIVFSKGGFVSFPVVCAAKLNGIKCVMHESDVTPGLANKMSLPFVSRFFTTFEDTIKHVKDKAKVEYVGPVLSDRLKNGVKLNACTLCDFDENKPTIMVIGGSLGAKSLNEAIRNNLSELLKKYQIIHICGKGQVENGADTKGYKQFDYVNDELKDFMAAADVVISRAGSNAIFELLSLNKPMILVPLSGASSRGEQMLNAKNFQQNGYCEVVADDKLQEENLLLTTLEKVYNNRSVYVKNMIDSGFKVTNNHDLVDRIIEIQGD